MSEAPLRIPASLLYRRAIGLTCPVCGRGRPHRSLLALEERCDCCSYRFEREPGYFLGSIYFNYGVTAAVALGWVIVAFAADFSPLITYCPSILFASLFPFWFLRYSRSLFMAMDLTWDPPKTEDFRD